MKRLLSLTLCLSMLLCLSGCCSNLHSNTVYSCKMKVTSLSSEDSPTAGSYINEITLATRRMHMYIELLKTTSFYERVAQTSGTGYTVEAVESMIEFEQIDETPFFYVTIRGIDSEAVCRIRDTVALEIEPYLQSLLGDVSVTVLECGTVTKES